MFWITKTWESYRAVMFTSHGSSCVIHKEYAIENSQSEERYRKDTGLQLIVILLRHDGQQHMPWSICPECNAAHKAYYATLIPPPRDLDVPASRRQAPPRPYDARSLSSESWNLWARMLTGNFA
jgi:hypothetical protein